MKTEEMKNLEAEYVRFYNELEEKLKLEMEWLRATKYKEESELCEGKMKELDELKKEMRRKLRRRKNE